jgi:tight adherence protein C
MNEMMLLSALVAGSIGLIVYSLWPAQPEERKQVLRRMSGQRRDGEQPLAGKSGASSSTARQMLDRVAPYAIKPVMPKSDEEMSTLREKLAQGGFRQENATRYFLASKTIAGLALMAITVALTLARGMETRQVFSTAAFLGGLGFMFPNVWLWLARKQRSEKIRNGLPDSLDLLVVSVESGLALDAGLQRVGHEMANVHPDLSEELTIATLEAQMGVPRAEALENMARRSGVEEMRSLVAVISQAERFGTSVAKALRTQADVLRSKRRLQAEERAQKTTVKLMLPLVLFIFPSIFVVLVGPAGLRIAETLGKGGPLSGK